MIIINILKAVLLADEQSYIGFKFSNILIIGILDLDSDIVSRLSQHCGYALVRFEHNTT